MFDLLALIHKNHSGESGGGGQGWVRGRRERGGHQKLFLNERKRGIIAEE